MMRNEIEFNGKMYTLPKKNSDEFLTLTIKDAETFFTLNNVRQQFPDDIFDITINGCTYLGIPNVEYDDDLFEHLSISIILPNCID